MGFHGSTAQVVHVLQGWHGYFRYFSPQLNPQITKYGSGMKFEVTLMFFG